MNPFRSLARPLLVAALSALAPAVAQSIAGRVVSPTLTPLAGIVVDAGSGSTPATTDALGNFVLTGVQANQSYDVEVVPPFGVMWAARELTVQVVGTATTNVGDVVLQPGFAVTGHVQNATGLPLAGCNLNVYDQAGVKQFTPRDGTDVLGNFQLVVAAGTWDVRIVPPTGTLLVPKQFEDVAVAAPVAFGTVTLRTAYVVTGSVVDAVSNVPIASTRLKIYDALTGERIYVPNDTTNLFGQFSLLLPFGIADFDVEPPAGNTHVARQVWGALIPGATALPPIRLSNGALLSGTVVANGSPVAGADIDVLLPDGDKVFTPRDTTTAAGTFSVAVPTGIAVRTRVEAPAGSALVGLLTAPTTLAATTSLGTLTLTNGIAVTGTVSGGFGPEPGVSLHVYDAATNVELVTSGALTGSNGQYTVHLPPGTWRLEAITAEGSMLQSGQQTATITAATTIDFTLPTKLARTALTSFGTPTIGNSSLLPVNVLLHSIVPGFQTILIDLAVELPNGTRLPLLLGLPLTLPPLPFQLDFVWLPVPPIPAADLGRVLDMVITFRDATGALVLDEAKTPFVVQ